MNFYHAKSEFDVGIDAPRILIQVANVNVIVVLLLNAASFFEHRRDNRRLLFRIS